MLTKVLPVLNKHVQALKDAGMTKGQETIISGFNKPGSGFGPRVLLEDYPGRAFLRMNANDYLALSDAHQQNSHAHDKPVYDFARSNG